MTGHGLEHVTAQAQADMARLLDLDPTISHLTIEVGGDSIHVARDWPSNRIEETDTLIDRIADSGLSAITVHDRGGKPPRRVTARAECPFLPSRSGTRGGGNRTPFRAPGAFTDTPEAT